MIYKKMFRNKLLKLTECLCRRTRLVLLIVPVVLLLSLYIVFGSELEFENILSLRPYNNEFELADGYLVWNPKCHMLSINPVDPSIMKYVKKNKFEACSTTPLMTNITRDPLTGNISLVIDPDVAYTNGNPTCCWAPVVRPPPPQPPVGDWDTKISVGKCEDFENRVLLPQDIEIVLVNCRKWKMKVYENVHAIINPAKMRDRLNRHEVHSNDSTKETHRASRKLSVLILGIDNVSRLNFKRSMPRTERYLRDTDWFHLRGYNKMGLNTFPNLMAMLSGQTQEESYEKCKPSVPYGFDWCPMLWYHFRNASYVTAYGEDLISLSTFNYLQVGFVDPPTDYYLRPYVLACEKLLKSKNRFYHKYCTGPEITVERIFNYAREFARTFIGAAYFGFFWTNSVSHDEWNSLSSMDGRTHDMFVEMERDGILNDSMVIFMSDHGMRYGDIRSTFVGWYEERLPFIYIHLPDWFQAEEPRAYQALRVNEQRLTSPYDLYETLREVLLRSGGEANSSSGCPTCQSLFRPVPLERGCADAGIAPHWCTCTAFKPGSTTDKIAVEGTRKFLEHVENIIKEYKDKNGNRLCAKLQLKRIHRVDEVIEFRQDSSASDTNIAGYFYLIEVSPGGARYETTIRYHGDNNFTINEDEISRVNSYAESAKCLDHGLKRYCYCI